MPDLDAALAEANETITGVVLKRASDLFDEIVLDQANELLDDLGVSKRVGAQLWGSTGGKSRIANRLIPLFPEHETYVEAFAGGAAVFWAKEKKGTEALNDMDKDIAGALRFVQSCTDAQIAALKKLNWVVSEGHHRSLQRSKPDTPASRFHRMAMLRFGGFMRNPDGGMDRGKIGVTLNLWDRLGKAKERLKGVKIHSEDYRKVMSKYDGPNAFFFLDPPYTKTDQNLGERGFDHKAFWEFLGKLKGKFLCTYDAPDPQKKFSLQILEHAVTDGSGGSNRVYKTHVITNYKAKKIESKAPAKKSIVSMDGFDVDGNPVDGFDDEGAVVEKQVPKPDASTEDKRKAQKERAGKFGIEALEGKGERLTFPSGFPTDLALYGDPVNLMYPLDPPGRARNARARFKQFAKNYEKEASRKIVHTRIVERLLQIGAKPSYSEDDPLDKLLPQTLRDKLKELKADGDEVSKNVRLLPIEKAEEERRIVFGVVLEPNEVDAQGDTISPEEIEQTAHEWLAKYQNRGLMHRKLVNGKVRVYESYIAPANLTIGGQKVKKGTWLLMYHVPDDEIWQQIKSGKLRGFSMGGFARRVRQKAA